MSTKKQVNRYLRLKTSTTEQAPKRQKANFVTNEELLRDESDQEQADTPK